VTTQTPALPQPGGAPAPVAGAIDFETTKEVGYYRLVWRRFATRKIALIAAIAMGILFFACFIVPSLPFFPQDCPDLTQSSLGPFTTGNSKNAICGIGQHFHVLGTDANGRDLLVRNLEGGRISLLVGIVTMVVTIFIGTTLGALAGFFGGFIDTVITAITNATLSIPSILLLIIFVKSLNSDGHAQPLRNIVTAPGHIPGLRGFFDSINSDLPDSAMTVTLICLAIALIAWPTTARIVRSVILSVREKEFVEAARAVGTPRGRLITRHLIPNALGPIVVSASLTIGAAILTESAISFLGYGVNPPTATWGNILEEGRDYLSNGTVAGFFFDVWPGLLILMTVLSFNYLGDALRDAFDPRSIER
jgi:peptide/nickel transport system permease protein